jgi:hypothetical protein
MLSTCGKCGGHHFEIQEISASGASYKKYFFQCASCGVPVGLADYFDNNSMMEKIQQSIQHINTKIDQLEYTLSNIQNQMNR